MITPNQSKLMRVKKYLAGSFRFAAEHLFFTFVILICIAVLLGSAAFYKYGIMPQKIEPKLNLRIAKFEENIYQKILADWQSRGERFEAAQTKNYPDLFRP